MDCSGGILGGRTSFALGKEQKIKFSLATYQKIAPKKLQESWLAVICLGRYLPISPAQFELAFNSVCFGSSRHDKGLFQNANALFVVFWDTGGRSRDLAGASPHRYISASAALPGDAAERLETWAPSPRAGAASQAMARSLASRMASWAVGNCNVEVEFPFKVASHAVVASSQQWCQLIICPLTMSWLFHMTNHGWTNLSEEAWLSRPAQTVPINLQSSAVTLSVLTRKKSWGDHNSFEALGALPLSTCMPKDAPTTTNAQFPIRGASPQGKFSHKTHLCRVLPRHTDVARG